MDCTATVDTTALDPAALVDAMDTDARVGARNSADAGIT